MRPLLEVSDVKIEFSHSSGPSTAVDGVTFDVHEGECVGIVGESGSGKSVTARSVLRLLPSAGKMTSGRIAFEGEDVLGMSELRLREFRGGDVGMVFQDPMSSLNPVIRVGPQIEEAMLYHSRYGGQEAKSRVVDLLARVQVPDPRMRSRAYPHQLSGGMRQRVMIAMAYANEPRLLIADEPTTALDVTVQAQILRLLRELGREFGTAVILITHNLALVADLCDRVVVMYAGRVVEQGPCREVISNPQHPYTWALLETARQMGAKGRKLFAIPGSPASAKDRIHGCRFHPRCAFAVDRCRDQEPPLIDLGGGREARCWVLMQNVSPDLTRGTPQ